jgi:hypothetical protein
MRWASHYYYIQPVKDHELNDGEHTSSPELHKRTKKNDRSGPAMTGKQHGQVV